MTNRNGRYLPKRTVLTTSYNWRDQTIRMLTDWRMDLKFNTTYRQVHALHFLVSSFLSFRCLCPLRSRPARSPMSRMVYYGTYFVYYEERHLRYSCLFTTSCLANYIHTYKSLVARGNNFIRHPDARVRVFLMFRPCWRISTNVCNRTCNWRTWLKNRISNFV